MRALARWGVTPLLAAPLGAHALGFGDIELQSALNQPFQAQIALVATADELQGLKIALAAPEVFERYGIDHPGFLTRFEFKVTTNGGRSVVQVSLARAGDRAIRDAARRGDLGARPKAARVYGAARSAGACCPAPSTSQAVSPPSTRPATPNTPAAGPSIAPRRLPNPRRPRRARRSRRRRAPSRRPRRGRASHRNRRQRRARCRPRRRAGRTVPCAEARRSGRSRTACVPKACRSIK